MTNACLTNACRHRTISAGLGAAYRHPLTTDTASHQ